MNIQKIMRAMHRDIGFLVIGLTLIFAVSGIILVHRDSDLLKAPRQVEKRFHPYLNKFELGLALRMRDFHILREDSTMIYFTPQGAYNKKTGVAIYHTDEVPGFFQKLNKLHRIKSKNKMSWFVIAYCVLLAFLAISSFWMYKPKTKPFKRGIIFTLAGFIIAAILLLL